MIEVQHASFRRTAHRNGRFCGEVQVTTNDARTPVVLVYFTASQDNDYDMVDILANDADTEIDWYDNNLHQAFANRNEWFETDEMKTDWGERESFKEQVLAYGSVREDLARELVD
ncbi:MAG TPA: hypothetical protein VMS09_11650 [Paenibacillus sp.]|uniref:hypothetical protein n=1 Tax=Paenibacillus sp. TaxID=58172 RepID=UPI0028D14329|nr:hypothetical protein [Paenibacillus sp.]HUC92670.1 hypothetical protein [Paenibacillus sp.]